MSRHSIKRLFFSKQFCGFAHPITVAILFVKNNNSILHSKADQKVFTNTDQMLQTTMQRIIMTSGPFFFITNRSRELGQINSLFTGIASRHLLRGKLSFSLHRILQHNQNVHRECQNLLFGSRQTFGLAHWLAFSYRQTSALYMLNSF